MGPRTARRRQAWGIQAASQKVQTLTARGFKALRDFGPEKKKFFSSRAARAPVLNGFPTKREGEPLVRLGSPTISARARGIRETSEPRGDPACALVGLFRRGGLFFFFDSRFAVERGGEYGGEGRAWLPPSTGGGRGGGAHWAFGVGPLPPGRFPRVSRPGPR